MRCLFAIALTVSLSLPAHAESLFGDRAIITAKEALEDGDAAGALRLLEEALDVVPPGSKLEAHARFLAGLAATDLGLHERALRHTDGLEQRMPEVRDYVWHSRAGALRSLGRWKDAVRDWRNIVRRTPGSPVEADASFSMGDAYYALGWLEKAAEYYDVALEKHGRHERAPTARFNRARIAETLRDYEKAAELYLEIGFRSPLDYFAPFALERHERLARWRRIAPAGFYDYLGRADRFLSARALDDARAQLEALEKRATSSSRRRSLDERKAKLLYREDRFEESRAAFQRLADAERGSKRLRLMSWVSRSLASQKRFKEAVDVYELLAQEYRGKSEARAVLYKAAWLAYNGGHHERSLSLFDAFVDTYGAEYDVDDAQWFIAWNSYRLGDQPLALKTLRKLRREYPRSKLIDRTFYWEARILHQNQRFEEATRVYQSVIDRDPNGYYAVYARQRMIELAEEFAPGQEPSRTLASLGALRFADADGSSSELRNTKPAEQPPARRLRGVATFDWASATGKRALTLMTLGFLGEATDLVRYVPALPGADDEQVHFARARLLHSLGDYHAAYKIALVHLRDRVEGGYTPSVRGTFEMLYPLAHPDLIRSAASEWGVPELFLLSVIRQESAFDDRARSWVSARGLMQIIPPTAKRIAEALNFEDFHPGLLNDPQINVRFGGWYLKALLDSYRGHPLLALGGYNAGPVAMNRWVTARSSMQTDEFIEEIPYSETRGYVKRIVANLSAYHTLYGGEFQIPNTLAQPAEDGIGF